MTFNEALISLDQFQEDLFLRLYLGVWGHIEEEPKRLYFGWLPLASSLRMLWQDIYTKRRHVFHKILSSELRYKKGRVLSKEQTCTFLSYKSFSFHKSIECVDNCYRQNRILSNQTLTRLRYPSSNQSIFFQIHINLHRS